MALNDIERSIVVRIRGEGQGTADAVRQEMARLEAQMKGIHDLYATGQIALRDYLTTFRSVEAEHQKFGRILKEVEQGLAAQVRAVAESISSANAWGAVIQ